MSEELSKGTRRATPSLAPLILSINTCGLLSPGVTDPLSGGVSDTGGCDIISVDIVSPI